MGEKGGYIFIACKQCGSVMTDPLITQDGLDGFFGEVQPQVTHVPHPEREITYMQRRITKLMQAGTKGTGKRFLDVCCRQGYAVKAARGLGFQAMGIDPHDFYIKFAREKWGAEHFEQSTPQDYAARGQQADIVFSFLGFSEQPDVDVYAAALAKIVAPEGKIYIEESDGNSFWLPRKFTKWDYVEPPLNFIYPSRKGMIAVLKRHGLKVESKLFGLGPFMRLVVVKA